MVGTRRFIDPATQSITYTDGSDTRLTLFDSNGDQVATTTIRTLLASQSGTIDDIATVMENFLQANGAAGADVGINNDRKF